MKKRIANAQQIKDIIEPIPQDAFCTYDYQNIKGQRCVLGHINYHFAQNALSDADGFGARELSARFLSSLKVPEYSDISAVNNWVTGEYKECTPKARVMHLIEDMIKGGY